MIKETTDRLAYILHHIPPLLRNIPVEELDYKESESRWSKKEIIGHLIDSAANNHQRFVRGQFEDQPDIGYNQDMWNKYSHHQSMHSHQLIALWEIYNAYLLKLILLIPESKLSSEIRIKGNTFPLHFIINDYVQHMEHHLHQIVEYR